MQVTTEWLEQFLGWQVRLLYPNTRKVLQGELHEASYKEPWLELKFGWVLQRGVRSAWEVAATSFGSGAAVLQREVKMSVYSELLSIEHSGLTILEGVNLRGEGLIFIPEYSSEWISSEEITRLLSNPIIREGLQLHAKLQQQGGY
jgi:hypothetical protein